MSRARREDQKIGDRKRIQMLLAVMLTTAAGNQGTSRKLYEIKGNAEEKGDKNSNGASTSERS